MLKMQIVYACIAWFRIKTAATDCLAREKTAIYLNLVIIIVWDSLKLTVTYHSVLCMLDLKKKALHSVMYEI